VTGLADALADDGPALWLDRGGAPDRALDGRIANAPPTAPRRMLAKEKGAFPLFDADAYLPSAGRCSGWTTTCAR
jgi:hypothetical protein